MKLDLIVLNGTFAIHRMEADSVLPVWLDTSDFYSLTRTSEELSIVCKQAEEQSDKNLLINKDWKVFKIIGPLDLSMTGIIAEISGILGENRIPVFTISTYDTDYILVKKATLKRAILALENMGHNILPDN